MCILKMAEDYFKKLKNMTNEELKNLIFKLLDVSLKMMPQVKKAMLVFHLISLMQW